MRTVLPFWKVPIHQAGICFVDQSCALQSVTRAFSLEVVMRQSPEFVVYERHQRIERSFIAGTPSQQ
jgi:5-formaminoimidazole-4-carboxamide-1-beta-D-ribofuranosyl 5'-monophosphate synthetase